jgi:F0F1-type ATP synthase membrane subunit b/b'
MSIESIALFNDTAFWVACSFTLFIVPAVIFGKGLVLGKIDAYIEQIRQNVQKAEILRLESQEIYAQYKHQEKESLKQAQEILEEARIHAVNITAKAEAELIEKKAVWEAQLQNRLDIMEKNMVSELKNKIALLALDTAREFYQTHLNATTQSQLQDSSLQSLTQYLTENTAKD